MVVVVVTFALEEGKEENKAEEEEEADVVAATADAPTANAGSSCLFLVLDPVRRLWATFFTGDERDLVPPDRSGDGDVAGEGVCSGGFPMSFTVGLRPLCRGEPTFLVRCVGLLLEPDDGDFGIAPPPLPRPSLSSSLVDLFRVELLLLPVIVDLSGDPDAGGLLSSVPNERSVGTYRAD